MSIVGKVTVGTYTTPVYEIPALPIRRKKRRKPTYAVKVNKHYKSRIKDVAAQNKELKLSFKFTELQRNISIIINIALTIALITILSC